MFFRDRNKSLKLHAPTHGPKWNQLGLETVVELPHAPPWSTFVKGPLLWTRLQRDGWMVTSPFEQPSLEEVVTDRVDWLKLERQTPTLERSLPYGWALQQVHHCRSGNIKNQPTAFESFALLPPSAEPIPQPTWEWADFDAPRRRLVWTADCTLYTARWTQQGPREPRPLLNTNGLAFEQKQAPY
jgi:hypothetical protein